MFALLLVFSLLLLPSCSSISDYFDDYIMIGNAITPDTDFSLTYDLTYPFNEEIITQIENRFEKLDDLLKDNDLLRALPFLTLFSQQTADLYYLADHAQLAYLKYCTDTVNNYSSLDEYTRLSGLYTDYSGRMIRMYRDIDNSVYKMLIFGAWDDSQVELALELADSYSEEIVELVKKRDDRLSDYHRYNQNKGDFIERSAKVYKDVVELNDQIAKKSGYNNYAEYAYRLVYSRDYSPSEAANLHNYVKEYIVPLAKQLSADIEGFKDNDKFGREYKMLLTRDLANEPKDYLTDYYDLMYENSNDFIDQWQSLTVLGDENSYPGAFTFSLNYYGQPICYYGNGYQDAFTVMHEQGHFSAALEMPGGFDSLDLSEIHSQGNEWLYFAYAKENAKDAECYEQITKAMLFEDCLTIIIATACDMFEQKIYKEPTTSVAMYDFIFRDCLKELKAFELLEENMNMQPQLYWHYAIVANSVYYLSYAVSMIPSIEIYVTAEEEGLESAAEKYLALSEGEPVIGFKDALAYAELSSPFEEEVYVKIKEHFS